MRNLLRFSLLLIGIAASQILHAQCNAAFAWDQEGTSLQVHFDDQSTSGSGIVSWQWNFGDGHTSDAQNPVHVFAQYGTYLVCLIIENELGCIDDICHEVHVEGAALQCEANFEWFNGNVNQQIQFHDLSDDDPDIVSWHWNFGDGHMSEQQNPLHTYDEPGVYVVCLIVENELGCVSDVCHEVQVLNQNGSCEAAFEWEGNGLIIHFIDNSDDDPDIVSWLWNFGDGHMSDDPNPVHTYDEPGVYVVCLTVINEFNCTDDVCHEVTVTAGPGECEAAFEWFNGNQNLQIQFSDLSDADPDIVSWHWDFGDGHTSQQQHPLHTYAEPGWYLVCLIIENEFGCVSDVCHEVHVENQNAACEAAFEWEGSGLVVHFIDNSDDDPDIVSWSWSFGDGHTSTEANPVHTYAEPGVYTVCLLVINELGCVSDICHQVEVGEGSGSCEAAFEWEGSGLVVHFIDNSDEDPDIVSWLWNFGDGHSSTDPNPVHTYAEPGVYTVCLIVVNEFGCASDICHQVEVGEGTGGCEAAFQWSNGNANLQIQFHDLSDDDPDIVSWLWHFGDGHSSDQQHPLHTYDTTGVYLVCLVVVNEFGCAADICHEVHVGEGTGSCEAAFEWEGSGLVIHFIDNSDDDPDIVSWSWSFGDGHFSNDANPVHTYAEPGVYTVCLFVVNEFGCASDICHEVQVGGVGSCEAAFEWSPGNEIQQIQFHDLSDDDPDIVTWFWNFGDGHTSDQQHPLHTFDEAGIHLVCLAVVNELGCVSDVCHEINVPQGIMIALELNPAVIVGHRDVIVHGKLSNNSYKAIDIAGNISPNPADRSINLKFNLLQSSEVSIHFYNINGSVIHKEVNRIYSAGQNELDFFVDGYAPGLYFITVITNEGSWTGKFFKI